MSDSNTIQITLVKSPISSLPKHVLTLKSLGLRRIGQTVVQPNTASVLGKVSQISHLISVQEG